MGMENTQRDAGLLRAVGTWGLAASTVCNTVGSAIFVVPAALAASVGIYAPLVLLVCALATVAVAICFAEGGSRVATSGGTYGYVAAAFGPLAGSVAGWLAWLGNILACGGVAAAVADHVVSLLPATIRAPAHAFVIIAVIGAIAWVNLGGVARGMKLVNASTLLKLLPLAVFLLVGATAIDTHHYTQTVTLDTSGLGRALILAVFAYNGMETSLAASGEVKNPARTIPRALMLAMLLVTVLYVSVQVVAQGILGPALASSTVPLADAMARISPALGLLMLAGAVVSMFGLMSIELLGGPRFLFAFARDGLLPEALGRVHPTTHVPHVAIICHALIAIVLALTGTFVELAVLSTLAVAALYASASVAAWRLARRDVAENGAPLNFRWLGAAMVVAVVSMTLLVALASRAEILGLVAAIAASVVLYLVSRALRRTAAT
jgi:APA family basic amino acid/polyamine antiporter